MIQPRTSLTGSFIRMLPAGLLYASGKVVKMGFKVRILDMRIGNPSSWQNDLISHISPNTIAAGITVMSGVSVLESLKISRYIKQHFPDIRIIWGGPHPTFSGDEILEEPAIDFAVRGYGEDSFCRLMEIIQNGGDEAPLEKIPGLVFRNKAGGIISNPVANQFEFIDYRDIPYGLITDFNAYKNINLKERVFPVYSVMGCPYRCAFCSSPAQYADFPKKWQPYPAEDVLAHIKLIYEKYGAGFVYFIDDDSFVDLRHVERIIDGIKELKINIKLGFRGARVNEILAMEDTFLEKLAVAGTNALHIGAESGSDRILKLMQKNITVQDIIAVNRKLAKHPEIQVFYNFIVGFPTETMEETKMTRDLILQLIKDNPACSVIPLNKPRPLPGTALYELSLEHGYRPPRTLEDWGNYDVESSDYQPVWLSKKHNQFIRMMFLCMYFIDKKIFKFTCRTDIRFIFLRALAFLYRPIAILRFKSGFAGLLIEDWVYNIVKKIV